MNPFRPTAGKMPPLLIGRESVIASFFEGLTGGAGARGRLMLLTGQRGFGKTVLLTEFVRIARSEGWQTVLETASKGMCSRIIDTLRSTSTVSVEASIQPSLTVNGVGSASLGALKLAAREASPTMRSLINERLQHLEDGKGILFAIDEAQAGTREELVALATTVQLVIQEQDLNDLPDSRKKGIAFVFAGLPSLVDELEDDQVLTFLRRCERHELSNIPIADVRNSYLTTVGEAGKHITNDVAEAAAQASMGFPYMIQLVGHYMWQASDVRQSHEITLSDVAQAQIDAGRAFQDAVCAPTFRGLSDAQQEFLLAMLPDDPQASKLRDISLRIGKSEAWAKKYRRSLIDAQVIASAGRGSVRLAVAYLGDYLRRIEG